MKWMALAFTLTACTDNPKITIPEPAIEGELDIDADGDGYFKDEDCDDTNGLINPGENEICDGVDNNCNGEIDEGVTTTFYVDDDGDGFGDPNKAEQLCESSDGRVPNDRDCNDDNAEIFPLANEICDEIDNDCDGEIDEEATTWALDYDGDGYGGANITINACTQPAGYVENTDDCNDLSPDIFPGAVEKCDEIDNDCDNLIDDDDNSIVYDQIEDLWFSDNDGDGYGDPSTGYLACISQSDAVRNQTDCDDENSNLNPDTIWYVDSDNDGFGFALYSTVSCVQPNGYVGSSNDCNDINDAIYPGADEYCDAIDQDCDGDVNDADSIDAALFYADADNDGYGDPAVFQIDCNPPNGYVDNNEDCDDADDTVHPWSHATETPFDGVDQDCDGEDVCHDLNCDAWPDLVIPGFYTETRGHQALNYVYFGGVNGYSPASRESFTGNGFRGVKVNDVNGDGYLDLIFISHFNPNGIDGYNSNSEVYTGSANGFSLLAELPTIGGMDVCISDLNNDGYSEILIVNHWDNNSEYATESYLYWGSSNGYSITERDSLPSNGSRGCKIDDLNADGIQDIYLPAYDSNQGVYEHYVYWGNPTGSYTEQNRTALSGYYASQAITDDLDQDGILDLLVPFHNAYSGIFYGNSQGYSDTDSEVLYHYYAWDMAAADLNADGYKDIVMCQFYDGDYDTQSGIWWSNYGQFDNASTTFLQTNGCRDVEIADVDQDGYQDLIFASHYNNSYTTTSKVYYGSSMGYSGFNQESFLSMGTYRSSIGDLNGDGYPEMILNNYFDGSSYEINSQIYWGHPNGYAAGGSTPLPSEGAWGEIQIIGAFE